LGARLQPVPPPLRSRNLRTAHGSREWKDRHEVRSVSSLQRPVPHRRDLRATRRVLALRRATSSPSPSSPGSASRGSETTPGWGQP
jgi:hypothetical protein